MVLTIPRASSSMSTTSTSTVDAEDATVKPTTGKDADEDGRTVLFTVEGMRCGGCSAAVQKTLDAREDVEQAAVNLVTETAAVRFKAGVDGSGSGAVEGMIASAVEEIGKKGFTMKRRQLGRAAEEAAREASARRDEEMEKTKWDLYKAWGLTVACLGTHLTHHLHALGLHEYAHTELLNTLAQP